RGKAFQLGGVERVPIPVVQAGHIQSFELEAQLALAARHAVEAASRRDDRVVIVSARAPTRLCIEGFGPLLYTRIDMKLAEDEVRLSLCDQSIAEAIEADAANHDADRPCVVHNPQPVR